MNTEIETLQSRILVLEARANRLTRINAGQASLLAQHGILPTTPLVDILNFVKDVEEGRVIPLTQPARQALSCSKPALGGPHNDRSKSTDSTSEQ